MLTVSRPLKPSEKETAPEASVDVAEMGLPSQSHLLDLPRELRDNIFEDALSHDDFGPKRNVRNMTYWQDSHFKQPPLMRVNHQLRAEALSAFYGKNTFCVFGLNRNMFIDGWQIKHTEH